MGKSLDTERTYIIYSISYMEVYGFLSCMWYSNHIHLIYLQMPAVIRALIQKTMNKNTEMYREIQNLRVMKPLIEGIQTKYETQLEDMVGAYRQEILDK